MKIEWFMSMFGQRLLTCDYFLSNQVVYEVCVKAIIFYQIKLCVSYIIPQRYLLRLLLLRYTRSILLAKYLNSS